MVKHFVSLFLLSGVVLLSSTSFARGPLQSFRKTKDGTNVHTHNAGGHTTTTTSRTVRAADGTHHTAFTQHTVNNSTGQTVSRSGGRIAVKGNGYDSRSTHQQGNTVTQTRTQGQAGMPNQMTSRSHTVPPNRGRR